MPIKPGKNESHTEWMDRCVPEMINPAPGRPDKRPQAQAVAICQDIWDNRKRDVDMSDKQTGPMMPMPDSLDMTPEPGESQADWMGRCTMGMMEECDCGADAAAAACMTMWNDAGKAADHVKANSLNGSGRAYAAAQIAAGSVNKSGSWSFTAADGNALLGSGGDDWANYGKHHLGIDVSQAANTKARYKYPFAKDGTVYRSGLVAIRQRASQQKDTAVFDAAGALIEKIDGPDAAKHIAYSLLEVKQVQDDLRIIRGVATTPTPDRVGDIVEPLGVKFSNPIPLLWQHDTRQPVGTATMGRPTKDGIDFEARIPKVTEPGTLKDRLDEVWQSIKLGLVKGVSIGFRGVEVNFMKDGGLHFIKSELFELSVVTIPANAEATIETIKAFDVGVPDKGGAIKSGATQPGATQSAAQPAANGKPKTMTVKQTTLEQITAFENKRAATVARMSELMSKAADSSQTLDDAEGQEYEDAEAEVSRIDTHLKRLQAFEKTNRESAKVVSATNPEVASESRTRQRVTIIKPDLPKGTAFVRMCMALAAARGNRWEAQQRAKQWSDQTPEVLAALEGDIPALMSDPAAIIQKAAIGAGTTTDATWASPLIAYTVMASEFVELLRPATIIGRIPNLRRVPFNIQMPAATTGTSMGWVGENAPKPVSNMAFTTLQLRWAKAAGIVILTDELVRFSNPAAEGIVRGDMVAAMAQFLDKQFVDPSVAAVTNVSPASITNGVSAVTATGTNQAAFVVDAKTLLNLFLTNNLSTVGGVWIMSQRQALAFSLMLNALGQPFYPNINAEGGTLLGYPVIASENIPSVGNSPADGTPIIFAVAPEILLADDGQVVIDASNQASVNMDSAPDSPPTGSTLLVSLWQMNMTGLRAERWINWLKRRTTAVQYISNANYA